MVGWLWVHRRDLRGLLVVVSTVGLGLVWAAALAASPGLRWALVVALPMGAACALWAAGVTRWGAYPPGVAWRLAVAGWQQREVMTEAVAASAEGARVVSVEALPDGQVEAQIIGAAGVAHADLVAALRDTLAESVLAVSGRPMASVSVVGAGARGAVRVRCGTVDPYAQVVELP